jgi:hypothetical protein
MLQFSSVLDEFFEAVCALSNLFFKGTRNVHIGVH